MTSTRPSRANGHRRTRYAADRWTACVITADGLPTTFDCSHLHHTTTTAAKCVDRVEDSWAFWHDDTSTDSFVFTTSDGHPVRECARETGPGRFQTRRYSIVDDRR